MPGSGWLIELRMKNAEPQGTSFLFDYRLFSLAGLSWFYGECFLNKNNGVEQDIFSKLEK
jgi:hypothetical protein